MTSDIEAIATRHRPHDDDGVLYCSYCGQFWSTPGGCDAAQLAVEAERYHSRALRFEQMSEREALAMAEAERLRAALDEIADRYVSDHNIRPGAFAVWAGERARAALGDARK